MTPKHEEWWNRRTPPTGPITWETALDGLPLADPDVQVWWNADWNADYADQYHCARVTLPGVFAISDEDTLLGAGFSVFSPVLGGRTLSVKWGPGWTLRLQKAVRQMAKEIA